MAATHTPEFSPQVNAAARTALKGTDPDRAAFVSTGYERAQQRDREVRAADTEHQQEVAARERDFVAALAATDPGGEVRTAAQWALRPGATDADVAEFFGYGWATGATLDLEGHRLRIADGETRRHHALTLLLRKALAAEEALKGAADAAKARAEAEAAWRSVADQGRRVPDLGGRADRGRGAGRALGGGRGGRRGGRGRDLEEHRRTRRGQPAVLDAGGRLRCRVRRLLAGHAEAGRGERGAGTGHGVTRA